MNNKHLSLPAAAGLLRTAMVLCTLAILFCSLPVHAAPGKLGFDHLSTGFPLEGAHTDTDCSNCHLRGIFKATPTECALCHGQGS